VIWKYHYEADDENTSGEGRVFPFKDGVPGSATAES
jgi:hypothetical protein